MGVGTLIVFIAMLLVAAVAAGVLIQTAGSLQEKSLSTGQQARSQISTNARVIEVSGSDGRNGNLTDFQEIVKLSPDSDAIKLDQIIFTFNTKDATSTLKYKGIDGICQLSNSNGYNIWNEQDFGRIDVDSTVVMRYNAGAGNGMYVGPGSGDAMITGIDLDDDGSVDHFRTCNGTGGQCPIQYANNYLQFNITNNANPIIFYVQMVNDDGSLVDLSEDAPPPYPVGSKKGFNFTHIAITNNGTTYGYMTSWRTYGAFSNIIDSGGYLAAVDPDVYMEFSRETYALNEDLNDDGITDHMNFNSTHAFFWVGQERIPIAFGTSILGAGPVTLDLDNIPITNSTGTIYGYITIQSDSAGGNIIPSNATIRVVPYKKGEGYFTAVYEQEGTNHIAGNLQRGDIIRLCFESPGEIEEDEQVRLNFIPKIGTPTLTQFVTPDVISTERVYMYP